MALLATIFYIFSGSLMPSYAFDKMQQIISNALEVLRAGNHSLDWLYLHGKDLPFYIQVFTEWQDKALKIVTNDQYIQCLVKWQRANEEQQERNCQILAPKLLEILQKYPTQPKKNSKVFKEYHDPFLLIDNITTAPRPKDGPPPTESNRYDYPPINKNALGLYDQISPLFKSVAKAMKKLEGRIQVEPILGDFMDSVDRMRHDIYRSDKKATPEGDNRWPRPTSFPHLFDRIHLSNIPDYIGGHLSTFLYAVTILKRQFSSLATSNCLRNATVWANIDDFIAHYQSIPNKETLES
ncbi:hypothetical protein BKA65DRAFT_544398 [Rhexocercosporidium sp. MPI-PUGE-AT-0058]|nr:hypothetical protein BKA65DRAFT_544398 [Rhexocercosporidium sp. MPI-PUGE-AT-0058]